MKFVTLEQESGNVAINLNYIRSVQQGYKEYYGGNCVYIITEYKTFNFINYNHRTIVRCLEKLNEPWLKPKDRRKNKITYKLFFTFPYKGGEQSFRVKDISYIEEKKVGGKWCLDICVSDGVTYRTEMTINQALRMLASQTMVINPDIKNDDDEKEGQQ